MQLYDRHLSPGNAAVKYYKALFYILKEFKSKDNTILFDKISRVEWQKVVEKGHYDINLVHFFVCLA